MTDETLKFGIPIIIFGLLLMAFGSMNVSHSVRPTLLV